MAREYNIKDGWNSWLNLGPCRQTSSTYTHIKNLQGHLASVELGGAVSDGVYLCALSVEGLAWRVV